MWPGRHEWRPYGYQCRGSIYATRDKMEHDTRRGRINAARGGLSAIPAGRGRIYATRVGLGAVWPGRHEWRPYGYYCRGRINAAQGQVRGVARAP